MANLLVKIELDGSPEIGVYEKLDSYMNSKFWERIKRPGMVTDLPHAIYQASTFGDRPNLPSMANDLKQSIEYRIGNKARVLMVQSLCWTETA
jgi:hypothetical protein